MRVPIALFISAGLAAGLSAAEPLPERLAPFLETNCLDCHDGTTQKGGLNLQALGGDLRDARTLETWVKVHDRLQTGEMPPPKKSKLATVERAATVAAVAKTLREAARQRQAGEGRVRGRRLNRVEYENTLRDLLALPHLEIREMLPGDGEAHGFDNVAEALHLSSVQIARYLEAARAALVSAAALDPAPKRTAERRLANTHGRLKFEAGNRVVGDYGVILRQGNSAQTPTYLEYRVFPRTAGWYRLRGTARGVWYDDEVEGKLGPAEREHVLCVYVDKKLLGTFTLPRDRDLEWEVEGWIDPMSHKVTFWTPTLDDRNQPINFLKEKKPYHGSGIAFGWVEMDGPIYEQWPPASTRRLFGDLPVADYSAKEHGAAPLDLTATLPGAPARNEKRAKPRLVVSTEPLKDAERLLRDFASRAFRRPAAEAEVQRHLALVRAQLDAGAAFQDALLAGCQSVLCAPDFLFFLENPGALDAYALASRLSYFLWKTMPDDVLLARAASGELLQPKTLRAEVERMLGDQRAQQFVEDFTGQWLDLRRITFTEPDRNLYPEWNTHLLRPLLDETHAFFAEMLRADLPARNVVASDFVFANAPLAALYGLPPVEGFGVQKVPLPAGSPRGGFLTQAAILKVTANGTTTSPVTRGAWVRERLLGRPVPPPPPDAGSIEPDTRGAVTIREQLDKHRNVEACAGCHTKIDPPGFALESFDVMGGWRDRYRSMEKGDAARLAVHGKDVRYKLGLPVDATGQTEGGRAFKDIHDFRATLLADERQLARNLAERLLIYATSAGIDFADRAVVEQIVEQTKSKDFGLRSLVHAVVQSPAFLRK